MSNIIINIIVIINIIYEYDHGTYTNFVHMHYFDYSIDYQSVGSVSECLCIVC